MGKVLSILFLVHDYAAWHSWGNFYRAGTDPPQVHLTEEKRIIMTMEAENQTFLTLVLPGLREDRLSRQLPEDLKKHCSLCRVAQIDEVTNLISWLTIENTYAPGQTILTNGALE